MKNENASNEILDTRCILYRKTSNEEQYYLPCYVRLLFKGITDLQITEIKGAINVTILVTVFFGSLSQFLDNLRQDMVLEMNGDQSIQLQHDGLSVKIDVKKQKQLISFTVRKAVNIDIVGHNIMLTPFLLVHMALKICMKSIKVTTKEGNSVDIKFNMMDLQQQPGDQTKFSFHNEISYGQYDVAEKKLKATYTNISDMQNFIKLWNQEGKTYSQFNGKLQYFQTAFFRVSVYRHPTVGLINIFFPLWLLGILNCGVFFQAWELADRVASIATIALAYVALLPTIRSQIPKSSKLTLVEIFTYIQISASILTLYYSITHRNAPEQEPFDWQNSPTFCFTAGITIVQVIFVVLYWIFHKCYLQPFCYNASKSLKDAKPNFELFQNKDCDDYFTLAKKDPKFKSIKCTQQKPGTKIKQNKERNRKDSGDSI